MCWYRDEYSRRSVTKTCLLKFVDSEHLLAETRERASKTPLVQFGPSRQEKTVKMQFVVHLE